MNYIVELKKGNLEAFDSLYESSKKSIFYVIYLIVKSKEITEDLMQDTYLEFLENVKNLKNDLNVEAFLVTTAKNKAINYFNRNKKIDEFNQSLTTFSYSNDEYFDTGLLEKIRTILNKEECDIFLLHVLGEYSFKEISKIKNIPVGTLTWMYQETRKKLKTVFEEK